MNAEQWDVLAAWHEAWRAAAPEERERLRQRLADEHPALVAEADALARVAEGLDGFLEVSALVASARDLVADAPLLEPGRLVGPYRVIGLLATGGMGEVYRATDTRLVRDVALKVLSGSGTPDGSRAERFVKEARLTAGLDDQNVVTVFDVGVVDGRPYFVAELLEGETLRERLRSGALPIPEALRVATDVAKGLVAAHAAALVHRDLKPENVFLTRGGVTKVLDFGIAKAAEDVTTPASSSTLPGVLLGTVGYLAPEQIRGGHVDARADLFALGTILYEMLTGTRAFAREHAVDTMHAILHEPVPPLPIDLPAGLRGVVMRLLEKVPASRFQTAADLVWALSQVHAGSGRDVSQVTAAPPTLRPRRAWLLLTSAGVAALAALALLGLPIRRHSPDTVGPALVRLSLPLPEGHWLASAPVPAPDGRSIAFTATDAAGQSRLMVRGLGDAESRVIEGTEGAQQPFWSPDGSALGYFGRERLFRVRLDGGAPTELARAPDPRGGAWSPGGVIVFSPFRLGTGLVKVAADGGAVVAVTVLDASRGDNSHRWPTLTPDGRYVVFQSRTADDATRGLYLAPVDGSPSAGTWLAPSESGAQFVRAPGGDWLVGVAHGRVEVRPFDPGRRRFAGDARALDLLAAPATPYVPAMVGASGALLAASAGELPYGQRIGVVARDGRDLRLPDGRDLVNWPRWSPDGGRLAWHQVDARTGMSAVWVTDVAQGTRQQVAAASEVEPLLAWSPDGRRIAHLRIAFDDRTSLVVDHADGTGGRVGRPCAGDACELSGWLPDGSGLLVTVQRGRARDVWTVPLDGGAPQPLLEEPFDERDARMAPDGHWIAYVSAESGRGEVAVRSVRGTPRRYVVSAGGGTQPVWRRDGRELFYVDVSGQLRAVPVRPAGRDALAFGVAQVLPVPRIGSGHWGTQYDVTADGQRIAFLDQARPAAPRAIDVVIGWTALLR